MRVSNRMIYGNTYFNLMHSEEIINQKNKEIGTGRRINIPSDDPFGTSRAMTYRTNLTAITQYITNSNRANSWLDLTDNSLQSVSTYLQRIREMVTAGANSTNPDESWNAMANEVDQIRDSIVQIANTSIDNRYIYAGEKVLEKAYEYRNTVMSDSIDLVASPIVISAGPIPPANNIFNLSIDGGPSIPLTLTAKTYDNTPGNTLQDLADDIQTKINTSFPATIPVYVKVTPDNKLAFYAGTQPSDGVVHTVVLREGNGALAAMSFQDRATTKELVGAELTFPIKQMMGRYPVGNQGTVGALSVTLDPRDDQGANYYQNWNLMIDDGVNVWTQTVTGSGGGSVNVAAWEGPPPPAPVVGSAVKYYLSPPLTGTMAAAPPPTATMFTVPAANQALISDFYVGMPVTITGGAGPGQTRTITAYDSITGLVTVDQPFTPPPDATSRYAIDASYYLEDNNKFKIFIDGEQPQEISLDGGDYSPLALADMLQTKITERGGAYADVRVSITPNNELRIVPRDMVGNNPRSIKLESGSAADGLWLLGFKNGAVSSEMLPNYEGNQGTMNYEINVGVKLSVNSIGDHIFDPIFKHLAQISIDLRAGNTAALTKDGLRYVKEDEQNVIITLAEVGAKYNRIEKGINRLKALDENFNKLLGDVEDTDIAKAILELKLQETAYQAALQAAARVLPMSLLDYLR
jgi:flagellin-like hook-associated protein FlgL